MEKKYVISLQVFYQNNENSLFTLQDYERMERQKCSLIRVCLLNESLTIF